MQKAVLKKKVVAKAAENAGSYAALAKKINRSYRALLIYRTDCEAPSDVVAAIERIALGEANAS